MPVLMKSHSFIEEDSGWKGAICKCEFLNFSVFDHI